MPRRRLLRSRLVARRPLLAYVCVATNFQRRIRLYGVEDGRIVDATTDRYESYAPAWSSDGKRLCFLSDRNLKSLVRHPWGPRQPDPYYDRTTKIYEISLVPGLHSPFEPDNELVATEEKDADGEKNGEAPETGKKPPKVAVVAEGLAARLHEVPIAAGNYTGLFMAGERLYWLSMPDRHLGKKHLQSAPIRSRDLEIMTVADSVDAAERSADGKKILVRLPKSLHVIEAGSDEKAELNAKTRIDLNGWAFSLDPREEWRQMFIEAWRLERDYFYDPNMHGIDWARTREKYLPLVDRVSDRAELGAELERDDAGGGYRVKRLHASDPDRQVLLGVRPRGSRDERSVVVTPLTRAEGADRRYHEWEYTRRLEAERLSGDRVAYVHLRAMSGDDIDQWTREFYPVFQKEGLIIDVRHNNGGNIESWILGKLLRKASGGRTGSASRSRTCSTPSTGTWPFSATREPPPTARRSRRASAGSGSAR